MLTEPVEAIVNPPSSRSKTRKPKANAAAKKNRKKCADTQPAPLADTALPIAPETATTTTNSASVSVADNCEQQPIAYTDYIKNVPDLLLAYFYNLRSDCLKNIGFGYNSKTFEPVIILHHIGHAVLELSALEFTSIFLQADSIQSFFNPFMVSSANATTTGAAAIYSEPPNRYMNVEFQTACDGNRIVLQRVGNRQPIFVFTLEEIEWIRVFELLQFFNPLIFWYKSTLHAVKTYYQHYVKLCTDCNTVCLTAQQFFSPNDIPSNQTYTSPQSPSFNYSRLFHEIGFMCRQDIVDQVLSKLYTSTNT